MQSMVHHDTPALVIDNVTKQYSQWQRSGQARDILKNMLHPQKRIITALDHLSFEVAPGEFVAYAGANGAGKSTTIKILSGILSPSEGTVSVSGLSPVTDRIELMRHIGVLFGQRTELWWDHPIITSFEWKKEVWGIPEEIYKKNLSLPRILTAKLVVIVLCNIVLGTYWLTLLNGKGFLAILPARAIKNLIQWPVDSLIFFLVAKTLEQAGVFKLILHAGNRQRR